MKTFYLWVILTHRFLSLIWHLSVLSITLINRPTYYKNPNNSFCIDLMLKICPNYLLLSSTFEAGLSDFHKLILTLFKSKIP